MFLFESLCIKRCGLKVKIIFIIIYKFPNKGQRAQSSCKVSVRKRMVEETEGCNINQDKYAKQTQVHFKEIMTSWFSRNFLHEYDKVGRVTFFLKNEFVALFH
jgi:hypothetical protein